MEYLFKTNFREWQDKSGLERGTNTVPPLRVADVWNSEFYNKALIRICTVDECKHWAVIYSTIRASDGAIICSLCLNEPNDCRCESKDLCCA